MVKSMVFRFLSQNVTLFNTSVQNVTVLLLLESPIIFVNY
uniref:Uncharacterized protein n=1 Tax=Rhizophora mucronata TaxID=61149 RepID=A0A2P2J338_RHIMU